MIEFVLMLLVVGIIIALVNWLIPIDPFIMKCIYAVLVICVLVYLIHYLGFGFPGGTHDSLR